jgi:serine protease Do
MKIARIATVVVLMALAFGTGRYLYDGNRAEAQDVPAEAPSPAPTPSGAVLPDFRAIIRNNRDAVVQITVSGRDPSVVLPFGDDSPFGEFFRRFGIPTPPNVPEGRAPERRGSGSGFIIGENGRILTNAHVVKGADRITVTLSDNREFRAKVLGLDESTDIALLEIDAKGLPVVRMGDSDAVEVGEWVLAIGAPFGMSYTATQGIISATGRQLRERYVPFIQTDAAVNPGNSGGPLFNARGEVIGINSQILSGSGGYIGLSFAIPSNTAKLIASQLAEKGFVERGYLGIQFQPVTNALARQFGLDRPRGALVATVKPNGPADKAGIQPGDVILAYNGRTLDSAGELPPLVGETPVGRKVEVTVLRDGRERKLKVTIGKLPEDATAQAESRGGQSPAQSRESRLGLSLSELTEEQKAELGIDRGVLVTRVQDGPAARAGIQRGDVLLEINRQRVGSISDVRKAIANNKEGDSILVLLRRGQGSLFLVIEAEE